MDIAPRARAASRVLQTTTLNRGVIRGVVPVKGSQRNYLVMGEDNPSWLGGLRQGDVGALWFCGNLTPEPTDLWGVLTRRFTAGLKSVLWDDVGKLEYDLALVSGGPLFLSKASTVIRDTIPTVFVITPCHRDLTRSSRRPPRIPGCHWSRLSHARVGGVSTGSFVFGHRGFREGTFRSLDAGLDRSIRHILDYSLRARCCPLPVTGHTSCYTERDRLSLSAWDKLVIYPTYASATGFGARSLTPRELALSYDLPLAMLGHIPEDPPTTVSFL